MKLMSANAVIMDDIALSPYQIIEKIGRTCYKSEDSITDDSAARFVKVLQNNRHWAMLEHYHLIFDIAHFEDRLKGLKDYPELTKYLSFSVTQDGHIFVSGSFRAFLELFEKVKTEKYKGINAWLRLERKCADLFPLIFDDPFYKEGVIDTNLFDYYSRADFIKFMRKLYHENEENFFNFISSVRHSSVFKYTGLYIDDEGNTHSEPVLSDGKEIINSVCNHSTLYQCYADSDKCMLCDLNNIINTIKENGDF